MIKRMTFSIFSTFISSISLAQSIDSLKNDEQVLSFVRGLRKEYKNAYIIPPKPTIWSLDSKTLKKQFGSAAYEKADFDNNGRTDLLFNGYIDDYDGNKTCRIVSFVALSFGNDSFRIKELSQGDFIAFFAARSIVINGQRYIQARSFGSSYNNNKKGYSLRKRTDTLTYQYEEFIERSKPANANIEKIEFCAFGGLEFGGMNLILMDSLAILQTGPSLHKESEIDSGGMFQAKLDPYTRAKISGILQYIDFIHLRDAYAVHWTDDVEGILRITYNHGKIKKVSDYGLIGTYGLAAVQRLFLELKTTQQWVKIKSLDDEIIFCRP